MNQIVDYHQSNSHHLVVKYEDLINGDFDCLESYLTIKVNPEVKILVSSGHKQREKIQEIKSCGVEHFLAKPYTADNLADRVHAILNAEA